jgi:hypothetical protein
VLLEIKSSSQFQTKHIFVKPPGLLGITTTERRVLHIANWPWGRRIAKLHIHVYILFCLIKISVITFDSEYSFQGLLSTMLTLLTRERQIV